MLYLDLETRSRCDLPVRGAYNYAADKSTRVLIASYALGNGKVKRWEPWRGQAMPADLRNMLNDKRLPIVAHNAAFERLVLAGTKLLPNDISRWHCSATQARAMALPGSLDDLCRALKSDMQKNATGAALIRKLSIPQADGSFCDDPVLLTEFGVYCDDDVEAMRMTSMMMPQLTDDALRLYRASEAINDRGMPIDTELCELALKYADQEKAEADINIKALTKGACKTARGTKLTQWVYDRLERDAQRVMEVKKDGKDKLTLDADTRTNLMALAEENPDLFNDGAVEAIDAADAAAASSIAKFKKMRDQCGSDGRLRGAFVMNGASGTGRFSSRGAQLHNLPRLCAKDPEAVKALMQRGCDLGGPVLTVLKSMLRAAICAPDGKRIVRGDWNAVEARGLPWLTGTMAGDRYLEAFRDPTRDIYVEQAIAAGLGEQRQPGKVVVLALGYGGAVGALSVMSKGYGVQLDDKDAVVKRWRARNPWAVNFWADLDKGARRALNGRVPAVGRVQFTHSEDGEIPALICTLPSGRRLYYPFAGVEAADPESWKTPSIEYLKAAWKPKANATRWPRARLWGGLSAENVTQAACADLLRDALVRGVEDGLPIIGHVHDEVIGETTARSAGSLSKKLHRTMMNAPLWAAGLPLAVEMDTSQRFRK